MLSLMTLYWCFVNASVVCVSWLDCISASPLVCVPWLRWTSATASLNTVILSSKNIAIRIYWTVFPWHPGTWWPSMCAELDISSSVHILLYCGVSHSNWYFYNCGQCKYTALAVGDRCKSEGHHIKTLKATKRFFRCKECSWRTVSLDKIPTTACRFVDNSLFDNLIQSPSPAHTLRVFFPREKQTTTSYFLRQLRHANYRQ